MRSSSLSLRLATASIIQKSGGLAPASKMITSGGTLETLTEKLAALTVIFGRLQQQPVRRAAWGRMPGRPPPCAAALRRAAAAWSGRFPAGASHRLPLAHWLSCPILACVVTCRQARGALGALEAVEEVHNAPGHARCPTRCPPFMLWELSMTEQRYRAVLEVLAGVPAVLEDLVRAVRPARLPWLPRDTSRDQDDPGPGQAGHHRGRGSVGAGHHWKNHFFNALPARPLPGTA